MKMLLNYKFLLVSLLVLLVGYTVIEAIPIHYHERKSIYLDIDKSSYNSISKLIINLNGAMKEEDALANLTHLSFYIRYPYKEYKSDDVFSLSYLTSEHVSFFNNDWFVKEHGYWFHNKEGVIKGVHVSNKHSLMMSNPKGISNEWLLELDNLILYVKDEYKSVLEKSSCKQENISISSVYKGWSLYYSCGNEIIDISYILDENAVWSFR